MLFLAAVLNYVDRQVLSLLALTIQKDLGLSDIDYGHITSCFLVAYTVSLLIAGRLIDRIGVRWGLAMYITWWSLATMAHAWANSFASLAWCRVLLGLGEAGNWPASTKAVSEWTSAKERAFAIGLYTMGATLGATIAPVLILSLASGGSEWRMAFLVTGAAGLVWVLPWLWLYRRPSEHPRITPQERALTDAIAATSPSAPAEAEQGEGRRWLAVLARREVWLLLIGRMLTDPVWYFYQFWFAKYLSTDRHLSQEQIKITWIVYAAAGVGSLLGGWLSGRLVKRGMAPARSRLWVMFGCACLMPISPLISEVTGLSFAMTLAACAVIASLAWLINISSLVVDLVPKHSLGTVFSVVATGSTIGGIVMNMIVATMVTGPSTKPAGFLDQAIKTVFGGLLEQVQGHGYGQWFLVMAFLHPAAWLLLWLGRIHRPQTATP
jgi:ACS family hexuronate transporter-like MFS transporter